MNPHFEFDDRVLRKRIAGLSSALKKEPSEIVRRVARQWVEMCIRLTPPVGKNPFKEGQRAALEIGLEAVRRDITRVFVAAEELPSVGPQGAPAEPIGVGFWKLARRGRMDDAKKFLREHNLEFADVSRDVDASFHKKQRNKRDGRVRRKPQQMLVTAAGRIATYIREVQKRVGVARSGWKEAAINLGVRPRHFPAWASRHNGQGQYDAKLFGFHPVIVFGNLVGYIQRAGRKLRIMRRSQREILKNLEKELALLGKHAVKAWKRAA